MKSEKLRKHLENKVSWNRKDVGNCRKQQQRMIEWMQRWMNECINQWMNNGGMKKVNEWINEMINLLMHAWIN